MIKIRKLRLTQYYFLIYKPYSDLINSVFYGKEMTKLSCCILRNLYAGQEATVRTGHGTTDWFQIGKGVCQRCILSSCLFNLYAEYIMRNAGIKIARRNINNLRYADDTTLMAESESV